MYLKQLSIFIENKVGRLQAIMDTLSENDINIRALSIAETTEFGILRIITPDVEKAKKVLREVDVISKITDVIAVYIDDKAGGLAKMLRAITAAEVNVEYMYAFLGRTEGKALMVLKADDEAKAEFVKFFSSFGKYEYEIATYFDQYMCFASLERVVNKPKPFYEL